MPGRRAHVVLEHAPASVAAAHEVAAGDVAVDAAGGADSVHGPREAGAADDQRPRHDPGADDLVGVIDVVDERVQRPDPLCEPALDRRPLGRGQHPRHQVQRPRPVAALAVGSGHLERDPLLHEDRVAPLPGGRERLRSQALRARRSARRRAGAAPRPRRTPHRGIRMGPRNQATELTGCHQGAV